jgi:WD repeat and SOF domain-containing protein 1
MGPSRYVNALRRGRSPLPTYSSAVREKLGIHSKRSWLIPMPFSIPSLPGAQPHRVRLRVLSPVRVPRHPISRFRYRRGLFSRCYAFLGGLLAICIVVMFLGTEESHWTPAFKDSTLVFSREDLQKIWRWEIDSGHYPSHAKSEMVSTVNVVPLTWSQYRNKLDSPPLYPILPYLLRRHIHSFLRLPLPLDP